MSSIARTLTGLGGTLLVAVSLLAAGCGKASNLSAPTLQSAMNRPGAQRMLPGRMSAKDDGGDNGGGGLTPLPKPTPTPPPAKGGGGASQPDDVDQFLGVMQNYGYHGSRRALVDAVTAVTNQYPLGWDPSVDTEKHWEWWQTTLGFDIRKDHDTYVRDAVRLAQYRFDVVYYVWVSKQTGSQIDNGSTPPNVNFDQEIPIVKGIKGDDGWIVQISPRGTVVDFLQMPREFLDDYNHLIPIPPSLY